MALVADPSLDGYNSFVSLEDADTYFEGTYFGDAKKWSDYSIDDQSALLITATRRLNALKWGGSPYEADQVLAFPRSFQDPGEYGNGPITPVDPTYIPNWLVSATCEMAFWIMTEGDRAFSDIDAAMLKHEKVGPLDQQLRDTVVSFPPAVAAILGGLGDWIIDIGGVLGTRLRQARLGL